MKDTLNWISGVLGGLVGWFVLVILFLITIFLAVGTLSAIQVRENLPKAVDGSRAYTYSDVKIAKTRFEGAVEQARSIYDTPNRIQEARDQLREKNVKLLDDLSYRVTKLAIELGELPKQEGEFIEYDLIEYSSLEFDRLEKTCVSGYSDKLQINEENQEYLHCDLIFEIEDNAVNIRKKDEEFQNIDYQQLLATYDQKITKLRAAEPLHGIFSTYEFFDKFGMERFLLIPSPVLVLMLTMGMGLLGSVVTMTWSFVRRDGDLTVRRFLTLPFVGMMSAFIIFIFINAGQLTLTADGTAAKLNPFVLSFVGIISGLLSERAYARISDVGSNFFKVDAGVARWGARLQQAMTEKGVTVSELAQHLLTSEEEIKRIADESIAATFEQQRLIAACLRMPIRDLFSDTEPEKKPTALVADDDAGGKGGEESAAKPA